MDKWHIQVLLSGIHGSHIYRKLSREFHRLSACQSGLRFKRYKPPKSGRIFHEAGVNILPEDVASGIFKRYCKPMSKIPESTEVCNFFTG